MGKVLKKRAFFGFAQAEKILNILRPSRFLKPGKSDNTII
jgi:hypothetical protein